MFLDIESKQQFEFEQSIATEKEKNLHCHICHHIITHEQAGREENGTHIHNCINPQGIEYTIACFDEAKGCVTIGERYKEHSWFPGYTWKIALCEKCGEHLGWCFEKDDRFYGLIIDKLIDDLT